MRHVVLLRGINIGPTNRIAMPALRAALEAAGFENVRTYLQSGNVVVDSDLAEEAVAERIAGVIEADFGLRIAILTRSADELERIVAADPLGEHATDPKRYQVSFLSGPLTPEVVARLQSAVIAPERLVIGERELFAWHPEGIARSKLWNAVAGKLGVAATARNWTTVTALLELARG